MSPIAIALFGMLCWGMSPVFAKLGLRNIDPLTGLCARTMVASLVVSVSMVAMARTRHFTVVPLKAILLITLEAILSTVIGDLAYYSALKRGNCSQVSVILSASPAVTIALSMILLNEHPTVPSVLGAVFVTIGLVLVSLGRAG